MLGRPAESQQLQLSNGTPDSKKKRGRPRTLDGKQSLSCALLCTALCRAGGRGSRLLRPPHLRGVGRTAGRAERRAQAWVAVPRTRLARRPQAEQVHCRHQYFFNFRKQYLRKFPWIAVLMFLLQPAAVRPRDPGPRPPQAGVPPSGQKLRHAWLHERFLRIFPHTRPGIFTLISTLNRDALLPTEAYFSCLFPASVLTSLFQVASWGIIKMNDYLVSGTRQQYWEEYFVKHVMAVSITYNYYNTNN